MPTAFEMSARCTGATMGMRPRSGDTRRVVARVGMALAVIVVAVGLAACGGATDGAAGVGTARNAAPVVEPAAVPVATADSLTSAPLQTDASPATDSPTPVTESTDTTSPARPAATPAPAGSLPDLSGAATDLRAIDSMLAADASAATSEGSDK
jgi:hypothetical protein